MASNEHRNLQDPNIHNPKGFIGANNETVLSKGVGTSSLARDGSLGWINKSNVGAVNYKMQGYAIGKPTFQYGEDIADNKSPFIMDVDYLSSSVSKGKLSPVNFFRIGQSCVIHKNSKVIGINGWLTSNTANPVTVAICRVTPDPSSTADITPTVIDEFTVVGGGNNSLLVSFSESTITLPSLSVGDIIFPMIREEIKGKEGSNLYINFNIESVVI